MIPALERWKQEDQSWRLFLAVYKYGASLKIKNTDWEKQERVKTCLGLNHSNTLSAQNKPIPETFSQACWHTPLTPALRRQRQAWFTLSFPETKYLSKSLPLVAGILRLGPSCRGSECTSDLLRWWCRPRYWVTLTCYWLGARPVTLEPFRTTTGSGARQSSWIDSWILFIFIFFLNFEAGFWFVA